jgi:hypothetical protein
MVGLLINDELERISKGAVLDKSRYNLGECLEGLTKTKKYFSG